MTLLWCEGQYGSGGKEGSGGQGELWLLKVAQQTALRGGGGGLIALSCPTMPARLRVDHWDL